MRNLALILGLIGMQFTAETARADSPRHVYVRSMSFGGSGCPAGSVAQNFSDDYGNIRFMFDEFVAELGPGISRRENRKNCQINIDLDYPQGWSYAISEGNFRGYVSLDQGVRSTITTSYYFQGQRERASLRSVFRGEIDDDYEMSDRLGISALVWSPCGAGRSLNVNTQVRIYSRSRNASGLMTLDSIDGGSSHTYGIKWRRCRSW